MVGKSPKDWVVADPFQSPPPSTHRSIRRGRSGGLRKDGVEEMVFFVQPESRYRFLHDTDLNLVID